MLKKFSFLFVFSFLFANSILEKAKLQCPTSYENNCGNEYFSFKKNKFIFYMCGNHKRSELRFLDEFLMSGTKSLEAVVKLYPYTDEFTFLQIHTLKDINKPILRMAIYKNHLKLFVFNGKKYIKKDLGRYNFDYVNFKIKVDKNFLKVYKNGKLVFNTKINYHKKCYFKAGVYLQRDGCAKAEFKEIKEI